MQLDVAIKQTLLAERAAPQLKKLEKAVQGIEAMFMKDLLGVMRKSLPKDENAMPGRDIYYDMLDQAISESMAKNGALGIGKMMLKNMEPTILRTEAMKLAKEIQSEALKGVQQISVKANAAVQELIDNADKTATARIKALTAGQEKTDK